ncbi:MAG TPA: hypothetical protein VFE16_10220 [Candidatus Cybelea sp.]|nr:hypothetical protein [Candidatus Cybelea sp.]
MAITGAAPYLGGPSTWLPLRQAVPELTFVEVDVLEFANAPDVAEACRRAILSAAHDAACVIAHHTAAKPAIEAVAQMPRIVPVLLISPVLVQRRTPLLGVVRSILGTRLWARALASAARSKRTRLLHDREYLKRQMSLLVDESCISDAMLQEAVERTADPRTARSVERTAEILLEITHPIDSNLDARVSRRAVLLGSSRLDRKTAARMPATILPGVRGAAMIEAPHAVAQALRELLS